MRLTLRTLLAYMDGLLESKDSQEIGKKIEDSKFASDLFHKIRDVMRRLRLGAPSVTERGPNLDCNTVAEYLDNVLPADHVPDFEEVCLKSEVHLAEVASSHQILTMVLGEPVEIEPESRQRMYQLPTVAGRVDEERLAAAAAATALSGDGHAAATPPAPPAKGRPRPVVPEYLRDPPKKRRLLPAAAIMFLLGAAIMLILLLLGQLNSGTPIGNFLQWAQTKVTGKQVAANDTDDDRAGGASKHEGLQVSGDTASAGPSGGVKPSGAAPASGPAGSGVSSPASAPSKDSAARPDTLPLPTTEPPLVPPDLQPPAPENGGPSIPGTPAKSTSASGPAAPATVAGGLPIIPVNPPTADIKTVPPGGTIVPPANPTEVARVDTTLPPKPVSPPAVDEKSKVARFTSDGQDVLLKLDAANAVWRRVLPEEFLTVNQTLLSLPTYRSRIDIFDVGATLELMNGTRIEILRGGPQGPPGVDIDYGRMVMKPLAQAGARLRVVVGSHMGTITLANVETIAGLEVARVHEPGTDPEKVLSHALTKLYVARGSAMWEEGEGKPPVKLDAPAELLLDGMKADAPLAAIDVPKWITANTISELDQRAAVAVSQSLPAQRSATLGLMEMTEARQKEIRWLAARCLGYLGQFDPLTAALSDTDFRVEWPDYFDQLKEAVARGPETAAGIRQSLEKQFGNDAGELYRMLWGYTDKDLEGGEDARLVKDLDHEALVFRVLAFANLRDITHKKLSYRPEYSVAKRLQAVQRWKQEQKLGSIRWSPPEPKTRTPAPAAPLPAPLPEPKPAEGAPSEVNPASAAEPIPASPAGPTGKSEAAVAGRVRRPPVAIPEPDPTAERPKVVFPEPDSKDSP